MNKEKAPKYTPEQQKRIESERRLSDAKLIRRGAKYEINPKTQEAELAVSEEERYFLIERDVLSEHGGVGRYFDEAEKMDDPDERAKALIRIRDFLTAKANKDFQLVLGRDKEARNDSYKERHASAEDIKRGDSLALLRAGLALRDLSMIDEAFFSMPPGEIYSTDVEEFVSAYTQLGDIQKVKAIIDNAKGWFGDFEYESFIRYQKEELSKKWNNRSFSEKIENISEERRLQLKQEKSSEKKVL